MCMSVYTYECISICVLMLTFISIKHIFMTGFAIYLTLLFVFTYIILNLKDSMVICEGEEEEDDKKKTFEDY